MRTRSRVTVLAAALLTSALITPGAVASPSIEAFAKASVGDQSATSLLASYPSGEQVTAAMNRAACLGLDASCPSTSSPYAQYAAYYGDRTTGGFTMRPGFVSGVGAEYAAVDGPGSLKVSVSSYASGRQALVAAKAIARGVGISLRQVAAGRPGPAPWGSYDVWTGFNSDVGQGVIYAISGGRYARAWIVPPDDAWTRPQWRTAFQGFAVLLPQIMAAQQQFSVYPALEALIPVAPSGLTPAFFVTQAKSAWLPYGRPDPALYESLAPSQLSLQYAIAGAPETLSLNATITPVLDEGLAQAFVDRLTIDPSAGGALALDGLPPGARAVHYDEGKVERLIYVQFVAKGAVNELTCSDLSITSDLVVGRAACLSAIVAAASAMSS